MKSSKKPALVFSLLLVLSSWSAAGELLDRVLVTVNSRVILESDLQSEVHLQKLVAGIPNAPVTEEERNAALERLIDRMLLEQEMKGLDLVPSTDPKVSEHVLGIRKQIKGAETEGSWKKMLAAAGSSEDELAQRIADQMNMELFIEADFRPRIHINNGQVRSYYEETFAPELRKRNAPVPPLSQVFGQIQEILTEQAINDLFSEWMKGLRTQARVRVLDPNIKLEGFEPPSSLSGMTFLPLRITEEQASAPANSGNSAHPSAVPR